MGTEKPGRGFSGSEITMNRPFRHNGSYTLCLFEHTTSPPPPTSTGVTRQRSCWERSERGECCLAPEFCLDIFRFYEDTGDTSDLSLNKNYRVKL